MDLQLARPITLKCGLILPNRLVKAAMAERLGDRESLPTDRALLGAFSSWSEGGWGLMITGNVDVDPAYIGTEGDIVVDPSVPRDRTLETWKKWAQRSVPSTLVQLNHPGRQVLMKNGIAPSPIPMDFGPGIMARVLNWALFGTPKEMTAPDIDSTIQKFAEAAKLAADAGFAGIELHGAHGYLLAQFLSAKSNQRIDQYGGTALSRAKFVVDVVKAIRAAVPRTFCVGIKLNSVDHQSSGDMTDCIIQLHAIVDAGVDFLEISGGTYEDPEFSLGRSETTTRASTKIREAFFLDFASAIRSHFPSTPLMVTGGFSSRKGMEAAIAEGHCDLIGIARPAVLHPHLPKDLILNPDIPDEDAVVHRTKVKEPLWSKLVGVKVIGTGAESSWYAGRIRDIGNAYKGTE